MERKVNKNYCKILREYYAQQEKLCQEHKFEERHQLAYDTYFELYPENDMEDLYDFARESDTFIPLADKLCYLAELVINQNLQDEEV